LTLDGIGLTLSAGGSTTAAGRIGLAGALTLNA
jgi:hypothetical protein